MFYWHWSEFKNIYIFLIVKYYRQWSWNPVVHHGWPQELRHGWANVSVAFRVHIRMKSKLTRRTMTVTVRMWFRALCFFWRSRRGGDACDLHWHFTTTHTHTPTHTRSFERRWYLWKVWEIPFHEASTENTTQCDKLLFCNEQKPNYCLAPESTSGRVCLIQFIPESFNMCRGDCSYTCPKLL